MIMNGLQNYIRALRALLLMGMFCSLLGAGSGLYGFYVAKSLKSDPSKLSPQAASFDEEALRSYLMLVSDQMNKERAVITTLARVIATISAAYFLCVVAVIISLRQFFRHLRNEGLSADREKQERSQ